MKHKNAILDLLFCSLLGGLLNFSLISGLFSASIFGELSFTFLGIAILSVAGFRLLLSNKITVLIGITGILVVAAITFFHLSKADFLSPWFVSLTKQSSYIYEFIFQTGSLTVINLQFVSTVAFLIMGLFLVLNLHTFFNIIVPTFLGICIFSIPTYLGFPTSKRDIYLFLFCFIVLLLKNMNLSTLSLDSKHPHIQNAGFSLVAILVATAVFTTAFFLPKPDIPTGTTLADTISTTVDTLAYQIQNNQILSFTENEKKLGGPIVMGNEVVMKVITPLPTYLSATYKDTYSGSSWTSTLKEKQILEIEEDDYFNTSPYTEQIKNQQDYLSRFYDIKYSADTEKISVKIEMMDNRTKHIFTPAFRSRLIMSHDMAIEMEQSGALSSRHAMDKNVQYTQNYTTFFRSIGKISNPLLGSFLEKEFDTPYSNAEFEAYDLDKYLTVPDELPLRVIDLTHELTDNLSGNYAKLCKIEEYLRRFPYTLEPEPIPAGEDFVDYFLFEGKEGYCVYYATAMAVMGRELGIPMRYVEGYAMPKERDSEGNFIVTNQQAHAWVEAYVSGFGWYAFEPTSGFSTETEDIELEVPLKEESSVPDITPEENPVSETEPSTTPDDSTTSEVSTPEINPAITPELPAPKYNFLLLALIILGTIGLLGASALILRKRYFYHWQKIDKLSPQESIIAYFSMIQKELSSLGHKTVFNETPIAYAKRVQPGLPKSHRGEALLTVAEIYSRVLYSKNTISAEEQGILMDYHSMLSNYLKKEYEIKYWLYHYLFLSC